MRYQKRRRGARLDSRYAPHVATRHSEAARANAYFTPPAHKVTARAVLRHTSRFAFTAALVGIGLVLIALGDRMADSTVAASLAALAILLMLYRLFTEVPR